MQTVLVPMRRPELEYLLSAIQNEISAAAHSPELEWSKAVLGDAPARRDAFLAAIKEFEQ